MTVAQRRALEALWPRYGIDISGVMDLDHEFGRRAPRFLEIGFGMGDALAEMAARHPERDFLGIEVYAPGVGSLLARLEREGLENIRLVRDDAVQVLESALPAESLDCVMLHFPDPWPKKRHHKRRLVQPAFVELVRGRLKHGGRFQLATDWEDYAQHMRRVLESDGGLRNVAGPGAFAPRPPERPVTKFETRGVRLGHGIRDLVYERP